MNEQSLFIEALERHDPAERAAFLDQMCAGDHALRQRLERLLQRHQQDDGFLESPTPAWSAFAELICERPGSVIGPYKLLQQIGEGGFGVVYMAEQEQPVRRRVALKIIKPGMDSRQVVARFEAERQALAMMDHQNIARVLDAGTTDSGRPYFVMELVYGVPVTAYCDDNHLTVRERLELFVPVCKAVQHAHQKGIIHRDLKPSNILVCLYDGQPVPKIIDFGVAKAVEQRLTERTMFTHYGQIIGTFEYMSPEQAEMSQLGVDTRSDIYSLGVMLYELLTGSTPFERLREAGLSEVLRTIKEVEPPRPSTRLSSTQEVARIASARRTEPVKLAKLVRGELDWIVMKALEKDRSRRYETANGLCAISNATWLMSQSKRARRVPGTGCGSSPASTAASWSQSLRLFCCWWPLCWPVPGKPSCATLAETNALQAQTRAEEQFELAQKSETRARKAQEVAQAERQQAVSNLYRSLVEEADALRRARGMGYRIDVFDRLQQALRLDTPAKDTARLRDEAVACLGDFVGLKPTIWNDFPEDIRAAGIQKIALTRNGELMAIALQQWHNPAAKRRHGQRGSSAK